MQAIILAAGMGKRLGELTHDNTKCMIRVNGMTLIERMLRQLNNYDLSRIIIVVGYKKQNLIDYIKSFYSGIQIHFIENNIYDKTNNIYSLYLAREFMLEEDTILLESDIIFEDTVIKKLLKNPYPNLALVAKYEHWMDGTVVTLDDENNILNFVSKKYFQYEDLNSYYKTVNIYKFSKEFSSSHYVPFLEAYSKALGNNEYYEQVLRVITLLEKPELKALRLQKEKWYEIDDIQDLDIAETVFSSDKDKLSLYQMRFGGYWRFPKLTDFCYLVNSFFPNKGLLNELVANFNVLLTQYPSGLSVNSLLAGKYFSVNKKYILVGNGASELIKSLFSFLTGKFGIVYPTFEEYPNRLKPEQIIPYYPDNENFHYSANDLIEFYSRFSISNIIIINPDNPSGNFLHVRDIEKLIKWANDKNINLIIDESFIDFAEESYNSTLLKNDTLKNNPNLIVIKSISKSYGVPGLRLGVVASSNVDLINFIRKDLSIWNINSFAEFYLQIFSKYENDYKEACRIFKKERKEFYQELNNINFLRIIPSQSNYFLCEVKHPYTATVLTHKLLVEGNILVKDCSAKTGFSGREFIRIAVKKADENKILTKLLKLYENN